MKTRLLTTAPLTVPQEAEPCLCLDAEQPEQAEFAKLMEEVKIRLAEFAGASGPLEIMSGTREKAMDVAVATLFDPRDPVIVIETGEAGEAWAKATEAGDLDTILFRIPWNEPLSPERLKQAIEMEPNAKGVLMAAADASTGVEHPVRDLVRTAREHGLRTAFETTARLGVSPCDMAAWGADCLAGGLDIAFNLPPGLCMAAFAPEMQERVAGNIPDGEPPLDMLAKLQAALSMIDARGLDIFLAERRALAVMCRAGAKAMGLEPAVEHGFASAATSVTLPESLDARHMLDVMAAGYGVVCSPGAGPSSLIFGHMGDTDFGDVLAGLAAFSAALAAGGVEIPNNDYLERAVEAFESEIVERLGQSR